MGSVFLQALSQHRGKRSFYAISMRHVFIVLYLYLFGNFLALNECDCAEVGEEAQLSLCLWWLGGTVQIWCSFWHKIAFAFKPAQTTSYSITGQFSWLQLAKAHTHKPHKTPFMYVKLFLFPFATPFSFTADLCAPECNFQCDWGRFLTNIIHICVKQCSEEASLILFNEWVSHNNWFKHTFCQQTAMMSVSSTVHLRKGLLVMLHTAVILNILYLPTQWQGIRPLT